MVIEKTEDAIKVASLMKLFVISALNLSFFEINRWSSKNKRRSAVESDQSWFEKKEITKNIASQ